MSAQVCQAGDADVRRLARHPFQKYDKLFLESVVEIQSPADFGAPKFEKKTASQILPRA